MHKQEVVDRLLKLGISYDDACTLRKISMTLHRWHELECGTSDEYGSWALVRGRWMNDVNPRQFKHDDEGKPFLERHYHKPPKTWYQPYPDKETPAIDRLQGIIARYPHLTYYIQGDPRGASLYILTPADVPAGESIEAYYSRGVPVYK